MAKATNQPSSRYAVCAHASFHLECLLCCHLSAGGIRKPSSLYPLLSGSQEAVFIPPWCDTNELSVCVP